MQQCERLQRLAQVVTGGGQKPRLRQVGELRGLFGDLDLLLCCLEIGDVVEGNQDSSIQYSRPVNLFGRRYQAALADGRQISGKLAMHAASRAVPQPVEERSKRVDVEMMRIGIME